MMARTNHRSTKRRKVGSSSPTSRHVLREWRGCDEPLDLKKGLHHPSDFLGEILQSAGIETGIQEDKLRVAWKKIAGEFIANHTEPVSLRKGELLLRVSQPALRFQLDRMKPELLARIQQALGDSIQSIRFTHG